MSNRGAGGILAWDPPRVLEHEWRPAIVGEGTVRYELTAEGDGTTLTFTHRGLRPADARGRREGGRPRDARLLDRLEAHFAGAERPNWGRRYGEVQAAYRQRAARPPRGRGGAGKPRVAFRAIGR